MDRNLTVLGLIPKAFPLEKRLATFLAGFDQYLYTSLVCAEFLNYHLYMNVAEPSYTLQNSCPAFFKLLPLRTS